MATEKQRARKLARRRNHRTSILAARSQRDELAKLTKPQLVAKAKANGIEHAHAKMKKDTLIDLVRSSS